MISIAIAHASWDPSRKRTLDRLVSQLGRPLGDFFRVFPSGVKEHASVWCRRMWQWADYHDEDAVVCLNDDVFLAPNFLETVEAMVKAAPDDVISLHTNMPGAIGVADAGHAWCRSYTLTGPAYLLPPGAARSLLDYWERLPWSFASRVNEDNVASLWAWDRQRPMLCSIPALCTHDTTTKSTLGYDHHAHRTPTVPWESRPMPKSWAVPDDVPYVPNHWLPVEHMTHIRNAHRAGLILCGMCQLRTGLVGSPHAMICPECLTACTSKAISLISIGGGK